MKMKSLSFSIMWLCLNVQVGLAQVPQGIPYQAAARTANGQPMVNTPVMVRFTIIDSVSTGPVVYQETHNVTTNSSGMFSLNIGMGTAAAGTFTGINWGQNFKFMKVELDTTATGNNYTNMGIQQMMSVPYALFSGATATPPTGNGSNPNTLLYTSDGF